MEKTLSTRFFEIKYSSDKVDNSLLREIHCHAQFEIIAVLEGEISVLLEGNSYRLKDNQCAVIPPLAYHTVSANRRGQYKRITALFDSSALPIPLESCFEGNSLHISNASTAQIVRLKTVIDENNEAFYKPLADSLMMQMLYDCIKTTEKPASALSEQMQKVVDYVDANISRPITLDDLADCISVSKSSVCHIFKDNMQVSPKQYILQKRMALAKSLIRSGIAPTAVAIRVGYDNYSNFYRMYKKFFEESPAMAKEKE